jgi:LPXTG-motif cell wall-anchored protein
MKPNRLFRLCGVIALLVLAVTPALAKGPPDKVEISGPGLDTGFAVTDRAQLEAFGLGAFEDIEAGVIDAPEVKSGNGYEITSLIRDPSQPSGYWTFDQRHYYAGPKGERGYVFYDGIVNGHSEYDGRWFRASTAGEQVMLSILSEQAAKSPAALPSTGEAAAAHWEALAILALLLLGAGGVILRQSRAV